MPAPALTTRELNRTHLARQHLLARTDFSVVAMATALAGLQAQEVKDPYLGLWSRISGFQHDQLAQSLNSRETVRASLMRGTIHLLATADYPTFFAGTHALHRRAVSSLSAARHVPREHHEEIAAIARTMLAEQPLTIAELGARLAEQWPQFPERSLGQVVRFLLPLVQVPPRGVWGEQISHRPRWSLSTSWIGGELPIDPDAPKVLIQRYLRAFGPASFADITAWSGVPGLRPSLVAMQDTLVEHRDEYGVVLYDLAGMAIVPADTPAPVRFLPGFDNALLGYKDRRRIISDEHRALISTPNGMFASTFLVDGFVAGMWRVAAGELQLSDFGSLNRRQRREVENEAEQVAPFWTGSPLPLRWVDAWKLPGKW